MSESVNKTNPYVDPVSLSARIDALPLREFERIRAQASLARAEAVAEILVRITQAVRGAWSALVLRPIRRLTTAAG